MQKWNRMYVLYRARQRNNEPEMDSHDMGLKAVLRVYGLKIFFPFYRFENVKLNH